MNARPVGLLRFAIFLAATASAACPDRISWHDEYLPLERQEGNVAFSWELQAARRHYDALNSPYLREERGFDWQTSEEELRNSLWPHLFFGPAVDSVLRTAKRKKLGVNVIDADSLTFMLVWKCADYALLCIDEKHRVWNVKFDYGWSTELMCAPYSTCQGPSCAPGGRIYERHKSEVVQQIEFLGEGRTVYDGHPCFAEPKAIPRRCVGQDEWNKALAEFRRTGAR